MKKIKFNILDLFVILVVVAAVVLGALYLGGGRGRANDVWVYFTVEVEGRIKGFHEIITVGDSVKDAIRNYDMGSVHSMRVRESKNWLINEQTREYFEFVYEDEEVVEVTIRARARETQDSVTLTSGGGDIKIGKRMTLEGKGYALQGFIMDFHTEGE